eukprot:3623059-Pleurochrysis_carterae.AAC.1
MARGKEGKVRATRRRDSRIHTARKVHARPMPRGGAGVQRVCVRRKKSQSESEQTMSQNKR